MNTHKEKESVTLREKPMKNGGSSLFLDYSVNGLRYKEYLKMYIVPETNRIAKLQNIETMKAANVIKARRIIELQNGEAGIKPKQKDILLTDFLESQRVLYLEQKKDEYSKTIRKINVWLSLYGHSRALRLVDKKYILDFFAFARKGVEVKEEQKPKKKVGRPLNTKNGLSDSTLYSFYATLGTIFNNAVREHLIPSNPMRDLSAAEKPKQPDAEREFLTLDEIRALKETPCGNEQVKSAFLFSCFTGLRIGDIEDLTWDMIRETSTAREVATRQNKTKRYVYVPLSKNAEEYLPMRSDDKNVWQLCSRAELNKNIRRWVKKAGIKKHITFHCARHTYATLLLTYGADLYTVSKLLGHSDVGVTQIYAKIIDQKKVDAVNLIPQL